MAETAVVDSFSTWLDQHIMIGERDVPARLLTLLGLLERLRDEPTLDLAKHQAPSGAQLIEHNEYVKRGLRSVGVESPVQEYGRRSNYLHGWAPSLLKWLAEEGFDQAVSGNNGSLITIAQGVAAQRLTTINEDKPLIARYSMGTAVAVINDVLDQAQRKRRAKDVAEYLVGAKLELRFGDGIVTPKNVNTPSLSKLADFRIGNTAIEVTTLERADKSHVEQITGILNDTGLQVWLLTRLKDREKWQNAVDVMFEAQASRVVVADIETFLGQNISELGEFKTSDVRSMLERLFRRYEKVWLPRVGAGGLRIVSLETSAE